MKSQMANDKRQITNQIDLYLLFEQSAKRQQPIAQINTNVMRTVRRDMRLKLVRKWARLIGGCLGIPMALVIYIFVLNEAISGSLMQTPLRIVCLALPLLSMITLLGVKLRNFRMDV